MRSVNRGGVRAAGVVAASLAAVLAGCGGGGGGPEPVNLDPTALCNSAGAQPKVVNGASCVSFKSTPVVFLLIVRAGGAQVACSGTRISPTHVLTAAHCLEGNPARVLAANFKSTPVVFLLIVRAGGAQVACSGTRISPTHVLTAAHCLEGNPARVVAANFKSDTSIKGLAAKSWVVHPAYDGSGPPTPNDVAVVTFPAGLPNPTMPILGSQAAAPGQAVSFAGWGEPTGLLAVGAANLTEVNALSLGFKFDGSQSTTCPGDSGGPMYRLLEGGPAVIGVASSGPSSACGEKASVNALFTNLQTPAVLEFVRARAPGAVIL